MNQTRVKIVQYLAIKAFATADVFLYALEKGQYKFREKIKFREEYKRNGGSEMRKQNFEPLKMNLQLFAKEPENEPSEGKAGSAPDNEPGDGEGDGENEDDPENDIPNLAEENAALKVQLAKMKKAMDKATSDTAKYKKQLREKQSAEEIALQEKAEKEAEREEAYQKLLKENTVTKYEKNFLALGYSEELASKAANAQYDGDTEELFKIQQDFQTALLKQKEAEWAKLRPDPHAGNGERDDVDAFIKRFGA